MKKLLVLAALTILTTSAAGCQSSWFPGKYLGRRAPQRCDVGCSPCGVEGGPYLGTDYIQPTEIIETPGPAGG